MCEEIILSNAYDDWFVQCPLNTDLNSWPALGRHCIDK